MTPEFGCHKPKTRATARVFGVASFLFLTMALPYKKDAAFPCKRTIHFYALYNNQPLFVHMVTEFRHEHKGFLIRIQRVLQSGRHIAGGKTEPVL